MATIFANKLPYTNQKHPTMTSIMSEQQTGNIQVSLGKSLMRASQYDQRFSYCLYVPPEYEPANAEDYTLLVAVHGTDRCNQALRDHFIAFAKANQCIVLSPLFPAGIEDADDIDNYKYIEFAGIRFDEVLLNMVNEVERTYRLSPQRFLLFGFSGGAHFTHRFLYLHPEHVLAANIAAPGSVTLITGEFDWWVGTADIEHKFGRQMNMNELRKVPILLTVGEEDTGTRHIISDPSSPKWMPGATLAGDNRIERLKSLYSNYESLSLPVEIAILPGVEHEVQPHTEYVASFFSRVLASR